MSGQNLKEEKATPKKLLFALVVLGSVVGLVEVVFGGVLQQIHFPYRAGLLTGLGFGLIAIGLAIFKKPILAIGIGLVAVLCQQLAVPILHVSVMCKANSCLAILLNCSALSGLAAIAIRGKKGTLTLGGRILTGGGAAFIGAIAFYPIGMKLAPCPYLLSFQGSGGLASFLWKNGLSWAVFSSILFPLGWHIGERISEKTLVFSSRKPLLYYTSAAGITVLCWFGCVIFIAGGL